MKIIQFREMEPKPVTAEGAEAVTVRWLIAKEDGAPHFAMRLFEIQALGHTPLHSHGRLFLSPPEKSTDSSTGGRRWCGSSAW
jgi:quercetin dioxygenase-like cupin family protein